MKSVFTRLFIIGTVFIAGCEGALVPLSDANDVPIDERLLGEWMALDDEQEASIITIWAFNDTEYYMEWKEEDEDEEAAADTMRIRAFSTELKDYMFTNIRCINCEEDETEWFFYRYAFEGDDRLAVQGIRNRHYRDAMSEMTRSKDVRKYVRAHLNDEDFMEEDIAYFERIK